MEAYSFNDINGLIDVAFSDRGSSSVAAMTFAETAAVCAKGGQPSGGTNGPPGYAFFGQTDQDARNVFFYHAQPQVVDATLVTLKDTAHAVTLERTRHQFIATVSHFLRAHGFGGK